MELQTDRCQFLVNCLDLSEAAQVDGARWERFQLDHLNDDGQLRIEDKARQIAWSFTVAAEALANAVLYAESTIFVSINLEEAREKVRYAKRILENLNVGGLPSSLPITSWAWNLPMAGAFSHCRAVHRVARRE